MRLLPSEFTSWNTPIDNHRVSRHRFRSTTQSGMEVAFQTPENTSNVNAGGLRHGLKSQSMCGNLDIAIHPKIVAKN